jgi:uncharacterized membrane protein
MTDPAPMAPETPAPPPPGPPPVPPTGPGGPRWIKIALAVSVALNLAIAGLVAGAWLRDGPGHGLPRDMSFGPFTEALSDSDRRALRRTLGERAHGFREARQEMQADLQTLLSSLRADPFDPAAAEAALAAIAGRASARLELGRDLIAERILAMSDAERQAFADRLERGLKRH